MAAREPSGANRFLERVWKRINREMGELGYEEIPKTWAKLFVRETLAELAATVAHERFAWPGLGVFTPGWISARKVRSPQTGEWLRLPRVRRINFKVAAIIRKGLASGARRGRARPTLSDRAESRAKPQPKPKTRQKGSQAPRRPVFSRER